MANLNQLELQNLRYLIGDHCTIEKKLEFYASQCTDKIIESKIKDLAERIKNNNL